MHTQDITHFHLFGGAGSGAAGFCDARPNIGTLQGRMVLLGGIDVDAQACQDFSMLTGVKQTCADLFSTSQYLAWNGRLPPEGWREADADTVRAAAQWRFPDIVFLSAPCKGLSGLQSAERASSAKYLALNELTVRGVWLMLEAFADDPPGLIIFENVPRIATRGRYLLDQITGMLRHYGYAVAETTHDCGELGDGLAQSRKRFLLVARHVAKVPPFLYEPPKRRLRAVGEVLDHMPLPGDPLGGPMHRIPALQWKTWVRLAFVEAGRDWRSLNRLAVENGHLRDYLIVPEMHHGALGVRRWETPCGVVASASGPSNGSFCIADPRFTPSAAWKDGQALGVRRWDEPTGTVAGQQGPLQGAYSVADPRHAGPAKHSNEFRIVPFGEAAHAVTSAHGSGQAVADPRPALQRSKGDPFLTGGHYGVVRYADPAGAVSASACHDNGHWSVADPRGGDDPAQLHGKWHVTPWQSPARTVIGGNANGAAVVADPRQLQGSGAADTADAAITLPSPDERLVTRIRALDGTWHRPFTTLELACLQSFIDPEEWFAPDGPAQRGEHFVLAGQSDQRHREAIGNAVPRKAAKAIGTVMGQTILLARSGETFVLGCTPIWVRPVVAALAVAQP